jgi:nucleoid DNA-binding protein
LYSLAAWKIVNAADFSQSRHGCVNRLQDRPRRGYFASRSRRRGEFDFVGCTNQQTVSGDDVHRQALYCYAGSPVWQPPHETNDVGTLCRQLLPNARWVTMPLEGRRVSERFRARWFVTKKDLAKAISDELGLTGLVALQAVQRVFDGIIETLVEEGRIELRNFGVFEVKQRKPRKARNPRTGESAKVPAKLVVVFKPGREMEERVGQLKKKPGEGQ